MTGQGDVDDLIERHHEALGRFIEGDPEPFTAIYSRGADVTLLGGGAGSTVTLRVTTVFRPEEGAWRVVHRHADPISAVRPPESVVEVLR